MTDQIVIKEGTIFLISSGCYSDYSINAAFKAKKDIPLSKIASQIPEVDEDGKRLWGRQETFLASLVANGYAEDAPVLEYHMGDYGDLTVGPGYCLESPLEAP